MNFKVVHRHTGAGCVQLSRAVMAADTWQVLVFDLLTSLQVGRVGDRGESFRVDSRITHHSFKRVIRVRLL